MIIFIVVTCNKTVYTLRIYSSNLLSNYNGSSCTIIKQIIVFYFQLGNSLNELVCEWSGFYSTVDIIINIGMPFNIGIDDGNY